jgi:precorrin-2 dehydrogenase/sirohydrochlorin ferrochelatase
MSVSTGGASPALARRIREDLEALFADLRFARFLEALAALRRELPRGERGARIKEAVKGFAIEGRLRFPAWLERTEQRDR